MTAPPVLAEGHRTLLGARESDYTNNEGQTDHLRRQNPDPHLPARPGGRPCPPAPARPAWAPWLTWKEWKRYQKAQALMTL